MKKKNYLRGNFNKLTSFFKPLPLTALFLIVFITNGYSINNTVNNNGEINLQQLTITGTVLSDGIGGPIPGVSILVKGTNIGAITDFDGNYTINVPSSNSILVFSYIGFTTIEKKVDNNKTINVTLTADVSELDEIIVVGYGVAKKETLTGAVEQVKSKAFQDLAVTSPALALQGRTPGLTVTRSSTRPGGEGLGFLIRGQTSVNGIAPLLVIDGVPALNNSSFSDMNPDDVDNISILKGASASIYGARGAGGVIIVTTKKGKGEVKVEASTVLRHSTIGIRPPSPTMQEYASVYLEAASNDVNPYYFFWDKESLEGMAAGEERIYENGILGNIYLGNGNLFDQMYGSTFSNQHNVSISGSTEKSDFRLSGGYDHNVGGLKTTYDGAKKYNFAFNYNYNVNEKLKIGVNVSYFHKHFSGPSTGLGSESLSYDAPLFLAKNPFGQWNSNFGVIGGGNNAIASTVDGGRTNNKTEQFRFIFSTNYKITDNLSFAGTFSMARDLKNYQKYVLNVPTYGWFGNKANSSVNTTPYIYEEKDEGTYKNVKGALNYKKSFGNHNLTGTLAIEAELKTSKNLDVRRDGFEDYGVYDLNLAPIDVNVATNGGAGTYGFYGYIARVNYDYKQKYLLELQGRRDGSSRFAEGYKFFNYGSLTAGWVVSNEDFLSDNNILSFLKLRGGYGDLGSVSGVSTFGYLQGVSFGTSLFGQNAGWQTTATANGAFSTSTSWEHIQNQEIGLDFRLLNDKVYGSVDFFKKKNIGMLIRGKVAEVFGATEPVTNLGVMKTTGWEVVLGWRDRVGEFDLGISANMSDTRNVLLSYEGRESDNADLGFAEGLNLASDGNLREGDPLNSFYMYKTDGFFKDEAEVDAYYAKYTETSAGIIPSEFNADTRLRPGDVKIVDTNGDNVIDDKDLEYKGDNSSHYVFGVNLDATYKNWDISAFFQGTLQQNVHRTGYLAYPFARRYTNHTSAFLGQTWTEENPTAEFPRTSTNYLRAAWNYEYSDFMLQNNAYVRLKSLVIGYNFEDLKIGKTNINKLRVYFSGNDLFELSTLDDGYDPESTSNTNGSNASYPFMRTWAFGVKVSL